MSRSPFAPGFVALLPAAPARAADDAPNRSWLITGEGARSTGARQPDQPFFAASLMRGIGADDGLVSASQINADTTSAAFATMPAPTRQGKPGGSGSGNSLVTGLGLFETGSAGELSRQCSTRHR